MFSTSLMKCPAIRERRRSHARTHARFQLTPFALSASFSKECRVYRHGDIGLAAFQNWKPPHHLPCTNSSLFCRTSNMMVLCPKGNISLATGVVGHTALVPVEYGLIFVGIIFHQAQHIAGAPITASDTELVWHRSIHRSIWSRPFTVSPHPSRASPFMNE